MGREFLETAFLEPPTGSSSTIIMSNGDFASAPMYRQNNVDPAVDSPVFLQSEMGLVELIKDKEEDLKTSNTIPTTNNPTIASSSNENESSVFGNGMNGSSPLSIPPRHSREVVLQRLSEALLRRSLTKIDLSQRGLQASDARLVKMALLQNAHLTVLKLGYNNLENHGACLLADGIRKHEALESLDLGFNNIGDEGCCALANAIQSPPLRTLYLAGNLIGQDGAMGLADLIRKGTTLKKLYLTGNRLGPDGVSALTEAIEEDEHRGTDNMFDNGSTHSRSGNSSSGDTEMSINGETSEATTDMRGRKSSGLEELFLGGTSMGSEGCRAVARMLRVSTHLRVLSLTNCDLKDDDIAELSASLKLSRDQLPLRSLQLSFNQISSKGVEQLANAIWKSTSLKELLIDNNEISDRGAQQLATVLPYLKNLDQIDVGFNGIKSNGMTLFMKAVAETKNLKTLSLSGNHLDPSAAKSVAYALAFNHSLVSLNLVNCSNESNILRQIAAGIVSNSRIALRDLIGFELGPLVVSLGFPDAAGHWSNEQILNFLHTMWSGNGPNHDNTASEEEKSIDPLHFLPGNDTNPKPAPVPAATVVEVAKKAFDSLVQEGYDVFSRRPGHPKENSMASPFISRNNTFVMDTDGDGHEEDETSSSSTEHVPSKNARSFIAPPEMSMSSADQALPDPNRKKRIVEWLCKNIQNLNKLAQQPFSSAELWRLHQHYFTPVVNESGGSLAPSSHSRQPSATEGNLTISSVPEVSRTSSVDNPSDDTSESREDTFIAPISDPSMKQSPTALGSFSMLKRKVSYRFLGEAALSSPAGMDSHRSTGIQQHPHPSPFSISSMMGSGGQASMPRKTKRARRNKSRISFLPRIKAKLDAQLDVCHEKALIVMRQLFYVEKAILSGGVNPIDPSITTRTHLSAAFAADAEMIIVDMI